MAMNPLDYLVIQPPPEPDSPDSWDMLSQRGLSKIGDERILFRSGPNIKCRLSVPPDLKARYPFQCEIDRGTLFMTNTRLMHLSDDPTREPTFGFFSMFILNIKNFKAENSILWAPSWKADGIPGSGGNIPPGLPKIEVEFTFSDGSMIPFNQEFTRVRNSLLQYLQTMEMGSGDDIPPPYVQDNPPPGYYEAPT